MKEKLPTSHLQSIVKSPTESSVDFTRRVHRITEQISDRVVAIMGDRSAVIPDGASYDMVAAIIEQTIPFKELLEESLHEIDFSSQQSIFHWIARMQPTLQERKNHIYARTILAFFANAGYLPKDVVLSDEEQNTFVLGDNIIAKSLQYLKRHDCIHPAVIDWIELWQNKQEHSLLIKATTILRNLFKNYTT